MVPVVLGTMVIACSVVAHFINRPVWAAAVGAGLVLVYWALEMLSWSQGHSRASFSAALLVALGGMAVRVLVAVVVLALIGFLAQPAFATAAVAFLAAFTLYLPLRLLSYQSMAASPRQAGARP